MNRWTHFTHGLLTVLLAVSCSSDQSDTPPSSSSIERAPYEVVTDAINRGDWGTLRSLTTPQMRANEYIAKWESAEREGHPVKIGELVGVQKDAELDGKPCTVYTFNYLSKDGSVNPHQFEVLIREQDGKSVVVDFWNFGW